MHDTLVHDGGLTFSFVGAGLLRVAGRFRTTTIVELLTFMKG